MKDNRRGRRSMQGREEKGSTLKNTLYIAGTILLLGVIAFFVTIMIYNNNIDKIYSDLEETQIGKVPEVEDTEDNNQKTEEASLTLGKTVEETQKEANQTNAETTKTEDAKKTENKAQETRKTETKPVENKVTSKANVEETSKAEVNENKNEVKEETKQEAKEPTFIKPVEGEMLKEYAKDNLVYSETLKEWITHTGVDIRAEKTTVVKAAEERKSYSDKK